MLDSRSAVTSASGVPPAGRPSAGAGRPSTSGAAAAARKSRRFMLVLRSGAAAGPGPLAPLAVYRK